MLKSGITLYQILKKQILIIWSHYLKSDLRTSNIFWIWLFYKLIRYCLYIDNQVSTFCVLSPLNFSIFQFDAVLKILKFWLVPDESGVDPEVVDIGSVAVGKELGGGTNLMMGGLLNDWGVLTPLSSGTSQNFNIFNTASNWKIEKFKGDNTQNVDTWLSMYKQYCSFYDLSDIVKSKRCCLSLNRFLNNAIKLSKFAFWESGIVLYNWLQTGIYLMTYCWL
jgi:hypothetical protein